MPSEVMTPQQRDHIVTLLRDVYGTTWETELDRLRAEQPRPDHTWAYNLTVELVREKKRLSFARLPAGRYALPTPNGVDLFDVERPRTGAWAGYCFIASIREGHANVALAGDAARVTRVALESDREGASALYGRVTGTCGVCGKKLTTSAARSRGHHQRCAASFAPLSPRRVTVCADTA